MAELSPEQIAERLRRAIRSREIQPGTDLNQQQLAAELGVSRIPIREALRTLGSEGLVVLRPGRGAQVMELDSRDISDLYDLRLTLEPALAGEILDSLSPTDIRHLTTLAESMEKTEDRDHWSTLNYEFHRRMYEAVDRPHWIRIVLQVMEVVEPYSRLYVHVLEGSARASHEHLQMIDALVDRDVPALEAHIRDHLLGAKEGLLSSLGEELRPSLNDHTAAYPPPRRRTGTKNEWDTTSPPAGDDTENRS